MSRNGKVIVAMSGGVDSSVAAALLKEQGYDPVGVFMRVGVEGAGSAGAAGCCASGEQRRRGCCSVDDAADARTIAGRLGIPFCVLDFQADFDGIITYFVDEYARGRTPNPCIRCNTDLKFGKLLHYADEIGASYVATGHYARILAPDGGAGCGVGGVGWRLARALNRDKDQSYVLFGIGRGVLPRCRFPLGEIDDKASVRRLAADLGLEVHDKPDSQEICFVPDDDYARLVRSRRPETNRPGPIFDTAGQQLGTHSGIINFTIGQRRGLGVATGRPAYVTAIDVERNAVTLGSRDDLLSDGLEADQVNWLSDPPPVDRPRGARIQIRYSHRAAVGTVALAADGRLRVHFDTAQPAVTPGQAAVCYDDDDVVLGGGWIVAACRDADRGRPGE